MSIILINGSHPDYLINLRGSLISDLVSNGHVVHVTSPNLGVQEMERLEGLGAKAHNITLSRRQANPFSDIRYCWQIFRIVKKNKPALVLGYTIKPNIWGTFATTLARVNSAIIITGLGYAFLDNKGFKNKIRQKIVQLLYRLATNANKFVIFQNIDDRDDFVAAGCLGNLDKVRIMNGSGVNMHHFTKVPLPDKPVFLMIARLLVSKGVREYAAAAQQVMKKNKDTVFLLAGYIDEGPDSITSQELEEWQARGINYLGPLDDIRNAMIKASVYALPSYREGTPRTVLEAMAMGRPIITSDAPGCRETVINNQTGFLVPVKNADLLADAMLLLANNRALREEMGKASFRYCSERFDVQKVNSKLLDDIGLSASL